MEAGKIASTPASNASAVPDNAAAIHPEEYMRLATGQSVLREAAAKLAALAQKVLVFLSHNLIAGWCSPAVSTESSLTVLKSCILPYLSVAGSEV